MKIKIKKIKSEDVGKVYDFIKDFILDYPNYNRWLKKCKKELEKGSKLGFYAVERNKIIGSVIFQMHKQEPSVLEIKNFRIIPEYRRKNVGSRLYRAVEEHAKINGFSRIQIDTHAENNEMIKFLEKHGFEIKSKEPIYSPNQIEVILSKKI